jgi:hypothetical protein
MIRIVAGALALVLFACLPAQARHHRHHGRHHARHHVVRAAPAHQGGMIYDNDGRVRFGGSMPDFSSLTVPPQRPQEGRGRRRHSGHGGLAPTRASESSTSWRGAYAHVCVSGHCGTVAAYLAPNFRGLFAEFLALGYNIGSPGCLSSGHMRHSLHHSGRACDLFDQRARNVTARRQPPASVQIEVARRHGLTAGCVWRSPDCGHFDVSGAGRIRRVARGHHRMKPRPASNPHRGSRARSVIAHSHPEARHLRREETGRIRQQPTIVPAC